MNQIYFVSSSGSNFNDGSNVTPWATVQYAIDTITSQPLVQNVDLFIKDGSYPEVVFLRAFSGSGNISLKAQNLPPIIQSIVQSGSNYSLDNISFINNTGNTIVVEGGTLLINNIVASSSDSCIVVKGQGVISTSGTLEINGNPRSVISCSETGLFIYNSTLIGSGTFTGAFCQISGGKVTIFNSLSSNSFGGNRVNISGGTLTIKTTSTSPVDTLPGSSYGFATGGQIFNETTLIFPSNSTLNPPGASVINAGLITEGILSNARLSSTVTTQGNIFNGLSQLVKTTGEGKLPPIDGSLLTNITIPIPNASSIIAGTLSNDRLSSDVTLAGNIFNSASSLVKLTSLAKLPALDGSLLTNLPVNITTDASLLSSGTLANARLTSLVTLAGNTFNTANNLVRTDVLNRLPAIDGSQLTNLPGGNSTDASSLVSGTLSDARLSSNVTLQGNIFNAASKLVKTDSLNRLPAVDGSQLTGLPNTTDASLLTSGTVENARLSSTVTIQGNTFNVANGLVKTDGSNRLPAIDGSLLTGLPSGTNASSLTTGTLPDARLSTNVTTQGNIFNGANQLLKIGSDGKLPAIDGSNLTNLPGGVGGSTNLSLANITSTTIDVLSSSGTDVTLPAATTTQAGLMTAADKVALASSGGGATIIAPTAQTIGDGTAVSFTITHNLNTKSVGTVIYETASPYELVTATVKHTTVNNITIETGIVPTTDQFTVVVYPLTAYTGVPLKDSVNTYTKAQGVTPVALTYGSTIPVDASLSNSFTVTLEGNGQFLNPTGLVNGFIYNYFITQDGTGSRIPTWGTSYSFGVIGIPTLSTAAGKLDWLSFIYIAGKLCFAGASIGF